MFWRFSRRIPLGPFAALNLSKGGVSVTLGPRGAHVTVGKRGARWSTGLPGTGLSVGDAIGRKSPRRRRSEPE